MGDILVKLFKSNGLNKELETLYSTRYGCVNHPVRYVSLLKTNIPHKLPPLGGGS